MPSWLLGFIVYYVVGFVFTTWLDWGGASSRWKIWTKTTDRENESWNLLWIATLFWPITLLKYWLYLAKDKEKYRIFLEKEKEGKGLAYLEKEDEDFIEKDDEGNNQK